MNNLTQILIPSIIASLLAGLIAWVFIKMLLIWKETELSKNSERVNLIEIEMNEIILRVLQDKSPIFEAELSIFIFYKQSQLKRVFDINVFFDSLNELEASGKIEIINNGKTQIKKL